MSTIKLIDLLTESRVSDFKDKYTSIPEWMQDLLIKGDFTANKKYIDWMGKIITSLNKQESESFAKDLLRRILIHYNKLSNIDINKYKAYDDFVKATDTAEKKLTRKEKLAADTDFIYEDDRFLIVGPRSQESVGDFAKGQTHWCIAGSEDHWITYYSRNSIVLIKDNEEKYPLNKLAITADNGSNTSGWTVYNADDRTIDTSYIERTLSLEAINKINDFLDDDESDLSKRQYELEEKRDNQWIDENWDGCIEYLARMVRKHYKLDSYSISEIKDGFKEYLGDNEYESVGKDLAWWSLSYYGRVENGWLGSDYLNLLKYYDGVEKDTIVDMVNNFITDYG